MKPILTDWTLVLAGSWNVAILNPDWLSRLVFNEKQFEAEMIIEGVRPQMRFMFERVVVIPAPSRVVFSPRRPEDADLLAVEAAGKKVLELLPVTPISGVGINFGYGEDEPHRDLTSLFEIRDANKITDEQLEINSTAIVRELKFEDRVINLRMTQGVGVAFNFNFHKGVSSADEARAAIDGKLTLYRAYSEALLANLYGLELEMEGAGGH